MRTHPKKKIEIVVEAPLRSRLLGLLDRLEVSGYTVLPAVAGRGHHGAWEEGHISDADRMVVVVCLVDSGRLDAILDAVYGALAERIGIVYVADVAVVRPDHF